MRRSETCDKCVKMFEIKRKNTFSVRVGAADLANFCRGQTAHTRRCYREQWLPPPATLRPLSSGLDLQISPLRMSADASAPCHVSTGLGRIEMRVFIAPQCLIMYHNKHPLAFRVVVTWSLQLFPVPSSEGLRLGSSSAVCRPQSHHHGGHHARGQSKGTLSPHKGHCSTKHIRTAPLQVWVLFWILIQYKLGSLQW